MGISPFSMIWSTPLFAVTSLMQPCMRKKEGPKPFPLLLTTSLTSLCDYAIEFRCRCRQFLLVVQGRARSYERSAHIFPRDGDKGSCTLNLVAVTGFRREANGDIISV